MATGKATIKGRNGTSISGKKVSVYSPQYRQTTGKSASDRGTTSYHEAQEKRAAAQNEVKTYSSGVKSYYTKLTDAQREKRLEEYKARLKAGKTGQSQSTQKVLAYVNRNNQKSTNNRYTPVNPVLDKAGNEIPQIQFGKGKSHAVGIKGVRYQTDAYGQATNKKVFSDAYIKKAYEYRQRTGKQLSMSSDLKNKVSAAASSFLSTKHAHKVGKLNYYANLPITDGTNAWQKNKIIQARNFIIQATPTKEARAALIADFKAFDRDIHAYKKTTGYSNKKILDIMSGKVQIESEGPLKKYQTLSTKEEKDKRWNEYQKRLEQKAIDDELNKFAGDSKIKGALADLYRATRDIDSLKATSEANTRKWNRDFEQAINRKQLTWSQKPVKAITDLQNYTEKLVNDEKHPYLELGENTLQVVEGIPAGLLSAADYGIQTKGKSLIPQAKAFVQGTVEFPFVVLGAANRVRKPGGLRDFEALQTLSNAAAMLLIGSVGGKALKNAKSPVSIKPTKLQEVSAGEAAAVKDIKTGYALTVRGNPVISYSKSTKRLQRGAAGVPIKSLEGKQVQAFTKTDTKVFEATLKQLDKPEQVYYKSGKKIADVVYKQKKPVTKPKQLEILSEHIPDSMKPIVKDTITKYSGLLRTRGIQVYGSVPQKLQMDGFLTRSPKDIEISVSNVKSFVSQFRKRANQKGFKENIDYRITGNEGSPKVKFKINGKWVKGIEVFPNSKKGLSEAYNSEAGYRLQDGIAYGFKNKKSIRIGGKFGIGGTKAMKLQEQAARKFAGGNVLKDGKFGPMNSGRVKDVRDLIEMGTAYEVKNGVGISKEIIQYSRIAAKKHPEILESPIINHIVKTGKIPTEAQIKLMTSKSKAVKGATEKELIFASGSKSLGFSQKSLNSLSMLSAISKTSKASVVGSSVSKMSRSASKTSIGTSRSTSMTASKPSKSVSKVSKPSPRSKPTSPSMAASKTSVSKSKPTSPSMAASKTSVSKSKPSVSKTTSASRSSVSSSKYSSRSTGGSSSSSRVIPPRKTPPIVTGRRKKQKRLEAETRAKKYKKAYRVRKNVLGDMESFFGVGSTKRKTTKKPASKLSPKKKTVKRVKK